MIEQWTLRNGIRVIGEKMEGLRTCTLGVWIGVGSSMESERENGLSHLIEHMVFKGTQKRSARDIAEEMDAVGGQLNAFTSKDCTCYYAKVIDEDIPLAVDILSDMTVHPAFADAELAKERGVVLEEIAMVEDTPEDLVNDLLSRAQFDGPLAMPILGSAKGIRGYSRDDILAFFKRHYIAPRTVVSVCGAFDAQALLRLLEDAFADMPTAGDTRPAAPNAVACRRLARAKDTEQAHLCVGFPGFRAGTDEIYPMSVFNTLYGGGMSSRLFQRIREDLGMVYTIYSFPSSYADAGTFNLYAGTSPDNAATVLAQIFEESRRLLEDGFTDKEFSSARTQVRVGFLMGLENASARMQSMGRSLLLLDRAVPPEETLAKIEAVTPERVRAIGETLLRGGMSGAVVAPDAEKFLPAFTGLEVARG